MPKNLSQILENDKEHQLLFALFFDDWMFDIDYGLLDYNKLFFLIVRKHRIVNHFFDKADLQLFPEEFIERLKIARIKQKQRALKQLSILVEIKNILKDYDFIVLKGLPLSQKLYNDFSYRDSSDIDILIKPKNETQILELLVNNGFHRSHNYEHHYVLKRHGISVEVHRKLSAIFKTKGIEKHIWTSEKSIYLGDFNFRIAEDNEIFNYYLINASTHYFRRLSYFIEIEYMRKSMNYELENMNKPIFAIHNAILSLNPLNTFPKRIVLDYLINDKKDSLYNRFRQIKFFAVISNYSFFYTFYKRLHFFVSNKFHIKS